MGEFIEIKTGVADLITTGNRLRARGESLQGTVEGINGDIETQQNAGETFPSDKFTDEFRKTYDAPVQNSEGNTVPVHLAIRTSAVDAGKKLTAIGEFVGKAMITYSVTDDEGGTDIASTARP